MVILLNQPAWFRGEVNAADAFDIGSFDEEDTKGKLF